MYPDGRIEEIGFDELEPRFWMKKNEEALLDAIPEWQDMEARLMIIDYGGFVTMVRKVRKLFQK